MDPQRSNGNAMPGGRQRLVCPGMDSRSIGNRTGAGALAAGRIAQAWIVPAFSCVPACGGDGFATALGAFDNRHRSRQVAGSCRCTAPSRAEGLDSLRSPGAITRASSDIAPAPPGMKTVSTTKLFRVH